MEYLPNHFILVAEQAGLSKQQIKALIGDDLYSSEITLKNPLNTQISNSEKEILNTTLVNNSLLSLKQVAKRVVFKNSKLYNSFNFNEVTALQINDTNTIEVVTFSSKNEFINTTCKPFINELAIDTDFKKIENLNQFEWQVIVACIEFFLEKYPTPNSEWFPDELLLISEDVIEILFKEIEFKDNRATWWKHWIAISNQDSLNNEEIKTALKTLSVKELIGEFQEIDDEQYYFISQNLLWIIRSIAWWDKGFILSNKSNNTNLFVFQASSLFVLLNTENEYHLLNINGEQLPKLVAFFMELDTEVTEIVKENVEIREEMKEKPKKSTKKFCTNCGTKLINSAKFCANCGTKL